MRRWQYSEPGEDGEVITTTITDEQILRKYWSFWRDKMIEIGKTSTISKENCILDFAAIHWADELKEEDNVDNNK